MSTPARAPAISRAGDTASSRRLGQLGDFADAQSRKAVAADTPVRKQRRRRLIDRARHAKWIPGEHERRYQALCDWQLDHLQQLVQAQWHAQALLGRQDRYRTRSLPHPPPSLLAALGPPPRPREAGEVWRQGALAILRVRKHHHIHIGDLDRALGEPSADASQRSCRRQVEVVIDQARQLVHQQSEPFPPGEPVNAPDVGVL